MDSDNLIYWLEESGRGGGDVRIEYSGRGRTGAIGNCSG